MPTAGIRAERRRVELRAALNELDVIALDAIKQYTGRRIPFRGLSIDPFVKQDPCRSMGPLRRNLCKKFYRFIFMA